MRAFTGTELPTVDSDAGIQLAIQIADVVSKYDSDIMLVEGFR